MIADRILGNLNGTETDIPTEYVFMDWFEADKKRLRKITDKGNEIGIAVGEKLKDGDILFLNEERCVAVKMNASPLIKIKTNDIKEMGRVCFEIGNRHLSLKITDSEVYIPLDEPTEQHLKHLDFDCERVTEKFDDFIVCKAHSHTHSHKEK